MQDFGMFLDVATALLPSVLDAAFAVVALASVVTALTPTPRDDQLVGKVYRVIEWFALNVGHAKEVAPNHVGGRFVPR